MVYTALQPEEYVLKYELDSEGPVPEIRPLTTNNHNQLDLFALMDSLHSHGIHSVVFEGGALLHASLIEAGLISEVWIYRGNKLLKGLKWFETVNLGGYDLKTLDIPSEYLPQEPKEYTFTPYLLIPSESTTKIQSAESISITGR
ncbi:unnamed protein product, partial [marine sediment metagenome]